MTKSESKYFNTARKMNEALTKEKYRASQLQKRIFETIAAGYADCGNVVHFEPELESAEVRMLCDAVAQRCGGTATVFSGTEDAGYAFAMVSHSEDLRAFGKEMTAALGGRGGGKPNFQQGRVMASKAQIEAFFKAK